MKKGNGEFKIVGIKTNQGYFLSDQPNKTYGDTRLTNYYINGETPEKSFHRNWVITKEKPKVIEQLKRLPDINHRYELIDKSLESEKFPSVFQREEVGYYNEDFGWEWKEKYRHLQSLYKLMSDKQEPVKEEVEFTYETILEVDELKDTSGFSFTVQKTDWAHEGTRELTEKEVTHQLIDRIIFPDIVLSQKPAKFTSEQMYKIVRQYIKQHINYEYAKITSDYNFCFTVEKVIPISEPHTQKTEIMKSNGRPYRKPRYNTRYVANRRVVAFEMTYSPQNYKGYNPIPEMVGENLEDLKNKVDRYCEDLIRIINKSLIDCPHCEGQGVIDKEGKVNVREFFKSN